MPVVIGLTGSAGAGKTTVAKKLQSLGCEVADADIIARDVLIAGADELRTIHPAWFEDGQLSFRRIAEDAFSSAERYRELTEYVWPRTRARTEERIKASKSEYFVYDASMLFEAGSQEVCDLTIVVTADDPVRKQRTMARSGWTAEQFEDRQAHQMTQRLKTLLATLRLHNGDGLEELEQRTERLFRELVPKMLQRGKEDGYTFETLEEAWSCANRWWSGDSLESSDAFEWFASMMRARGGYHSLSHIERMVAKYRATLAITDLVGSPRILPWIFAHDLVYVPGAQDNETESAAKMDQILEGIHAYRRFDRDDRIAIESTKTHQPIEPAQLDDPIHLRAIYLLHDLDLEILGASPEEYEAYRAGVYEEYLAASDNPPAFPSQWNKGRRAFLEGMLEREQIYKTPFFEALEQRARNNMQRERENILREPA